jgi:hypothetical protein
MLPYGSTLNSIDFQAFGKKNVSGRVFIGLYNDRQYTSQIDINSVSLKNTLYAYARYKNVFYIAPWALVLVIAGIIAISFTTYYLIRNVKKNKK